MRNYSSKKMVMSSLMIALVFLATYFTRIPTPLPGGYFNLGDAVIMLAAFALGPVGGLIAGAVGSGLADIAAGALLFAPITLVVKGIEGLVVGLLAVHGINAPANATDDHRMASGKAAHLSTIIAAAVGAFIMVAGYFLAEAFLLGAFDEAFGLAAAVAELLPNSIQGVLSAILGYILILILSKVNLKKYIS